MSVGALPAVSLHKEGRLAGHRYRVFDLSWSPTQPSRLASVGQDCGFLWNIEAGAAAAKPLKIAGNDLMRVCWHPDGAHVLTGSAEGKINVCATTDGAVTTTLQASAEDEVYGLAMLSCEGLLAASTGASLQQWDLTRGTQTAKVELGVAPERGIIYGGEHRNPKGEAYVFGLSARGRAISAALSDGTVRLFDSQTLQQLAALDVHAQRGAPAFATAISPSSPQMASSDGKGVVLLWDLRHVGRGPISESRTSEGPVHALAFVPGGDGDTELLLTGGADHKVHAHETRTAELATERTVRLASPVLCVEAAPAAARQFAIGGGTGELMSDAGVSLWQVGGRCGMKEEQMGKGKDARKDVGTDERAGTNKRRREVGEAAPATMAGDECCGKCPGSQSERSGGDTRDKGSK
jgi:hypothetical protein